MQWMSASVTIGLMTTTLAACGGAGQGGGGPAEGNIAPTNLNGPAPIGAPVVPGAQDTLPGMSGPPGGGGSGQPATGVTQTP